MFIGNALSVIQTDGPGGNLERKFILKTLRDFGFGQRTIESIILKDVSDSINHFKSKLGEPVNPVNSLKIGVFNAILRFITDQEFAQHDPKLHSLWENFETCDKKLNSGSTNGIFMCNYIFESLPV